jgi:hypothetical protein
LLGWLAALLFVLASVLGLAAWKDARGRQPYLALAKSVAAGTEIDDAALVRVDAAVDGHINLVKAGDRRLVVGKVAARSLQAGSFLSPTDWVDGAGPGGGRVIVPVTLAGDRLPGQLRVGDRVRLIRTGSGIGRSDAEPTVLAQEGIVSGVTTGSRLSDRIVVSVSVLDNEATALAAASADGRVAVILVGHAG